MTDEINVLSVEDSAADRCLINALFVNHDHRAKLHFASDGSEALEFLHRRGAHLHAPVPDLILLDLNMPRCDGREVLREIKEDSELRNIPVIVLTTSSREEDIFQSYDLHANCYLTKPVELDQFDEIIRKIKEYWLGSARLPHHYGSEETMLR